MSANSLKAGHNLIFNKQRRRLMTQYKKRTNLQEEFIETLFTE